MGVGIRIADAPYPFRSYRDQIRAGWMSAYIRLPRFVAENNLLALVTQLGQGNGREAVTIDFADVKFMIPGAIVALTAKVAGWKARGVSVDFTNFERAEAYRYLQRMNLFRVCGWDLPESFRRHDPRERFVPVRRITGQQDPDRLANEVASVIVPDLTDAWDPDHTGPFDFVEYAISELARNVSNHSRGTGFVCAQYYQSKDSVGVCIADDGIGIRQSFQNSPHWRDGMSDRDAVRLALQPEVSSKSHLRTLYGASENAGVGLTLLEGLSRKTHGEFLVISGSGYYAPHSDGNFREGYGFQGTLCAMTFRRSEVRNFATLLYAAKLDAGLIQPQRGDHSEMFQ